MTKAGELDLKIPKLRKLPFETAIIERYRRREESVEEALIEMYLAGVSVRRVEDITEALWGTKVSPGTISNLNQKVYGKIEEWRNRPLVAEYPGYPPTIKGCRISATAFCSSLYQPQKVYVPLGKFFVHPLMHTFTSTGVSSS